MKALTSLGRRIGHLRNVLISNTCNNIVFIRLQYNSQKKKGGGATSAQQAQLPVWYTGSPITATSYAYYMYEKRIWKHVVFPRCGFLQKQLAGKYIRRRRTTRVVVIVGTQQICGGHGAEPT